MNASASNVSTNASASNILMDQIQSIYLVNLQLFWNLIIYLGVAPLPLISNILVAVVLYRSRTKLKSHHYRLLLHMTVVTTTFDLNSIVMIGVKKISQALLKMHDIMPRWNCALLFSTHEFLMAVDCSNVVVVSFDRFFAVSFPMKYKNISLRKTYKIVTLTTPWMFASFILFLKYLQYTDSFSKELLGICLLGSTYPVGYTFVYTFAAAGICITSLLFYYSGIGVVLYRLNANKASSKKLKKELGLRLIVACATDATIYVFTFFTSIVFTLAYYLWAPTLVQIAMGPFSGLFLYLSQTPRVLIMYILNKDFRNCFKTVFLGASYVVPITSTTRITVGATTDKF